METVESGPMIGQTIRVQSDVNRKCQCKEENACKWGRFDAAKMARRSHRNAWEKIGKVILYFLCRSHRR